LYEDEAGAAVEDGRAGKSNGEGKAGAALAFGDEEAGRAAACVGAIGGI
jgi:hypothetical protein